MPSYDEGKTEVCSWIRERFDKNSTILDVGACDGKWRMMLTEYQNMDAVEIFPANAAQITPIYRSTFCEDIKGFEYIFYDLIIFGDVIEHMSVENAKSVLEYASKRCRDMIVAVPFLYPQEALYGNPWEKHIQDDLTPEVFAERYPGFSVIYQTGNYAYYHKEGT